ncbi:uracil DNA glycosylase superfamily protein [mine drainage metagenome]|uniref:Type-4 uracil-DNA glycosylase n=1 Tax=mine drainage metagenome TaxID=410659 RepID=A0A1J5RY17_9ZZZZ
MTFDMSPQHLLRWYLEAGVDETIGEAPVDRYAQSRLPAAAPLRPDRPPAAAPSSAPSAASSSAPSAASPPAAMPEVRQGASQLAAAATTLAALRAAMEAFDGCALKKTCQRTVFADGNPEARLMLIGEAPGADEDRQGLPFVGVSGQLLDRMLASIGLDRNDVYITNVVPWRPPGNRKPEPAEIALCLPFIQRHIALVDPALLVFLGGAPANALLARVEGITRLRGHWMDYHAGGLPRPIPAMATFHPAYLLRTPIHKRESWQDFRAVRKRLESVG